MTFFATFAPAALLPLIRENLSLTKTQAGLSGKTLPTCTLAADAFQFSSVIFFQSH